VEILGTDGQPVAHDEAGRLRYRGPGVATRFLDENGNEHGPEPGGWFYPGDLAAQDDDGYLTLRGREKDMIIRGGVNVYPGEIERVLLTHPDIDDAAVLGRASEKLGEEIVAFVTGRGVDTSALLSHCAASLAPYKVPAEIIFIEEMPKNSLGKVLKKELARRL
jgi:acyl-CoA synthetase (AMP-forming)/AMP-acid ligase II